MTDQDKNRIVAEWLGWTDYGNGYWWTTEDDNAELVPLIDYYNSPNNEVFGLLDVLVERGYDCMVLNVGNLWQVFIAVRFVPESKIIGDLYASKSIALVDAMIAMIEKEKQP